eukprot:3446016-Rhodomonas_salina.3
MQEFKNEVQLGALETALHAAVRDYKAEVNAEDGKNKAAAKAELEREVDLLDDDDLEMLQQQRLKEMKAEAMRLQEAAKAGHGQYRDIEEGNFLQEVTTSQLAVCHFYHPDFQRCKIVDKHMSEVAR